MAFWRRIWQRDSAEALAACTALDVGTEFAKALVFDIDAEGHGTVSSTLVQLSWGLPEPPRLLHAAGRPCVTPYQDLSTLIA